jgi:pyruvate dehydrogenase E1 component
VIATDWIRTYPDLVAPWLPPTHLVLGTDGFGRSDAREALRELFEIDPAHIAAAAMAGLARDGRMSGAEAAAGMAELGVNPDATDPRSL